MEYLLALLLAVGLHTLIVGFAAFAGMIATKHWIYAGIFFVAVAVFSMTLFPIYLGIFQAI